MSGFVSGVGSAAFQLAFQLSPIILTGGIAQSLLGGGLPIVVITESVDYVLGLLSASTSLDLSTFFCNFAPVPGSTLAENRIGEYPFANRQVAGNAIIQAPLTLSMLMYCPTQNNYLASLGTMTALVSALNAHEQLGGTYTVLTPKYIYTDGIRKRMVDVSGNQSKQSQSAYQIDFEFPLLTLEQAQSAQNSLTSLLTGGTSLSSIPGYASITSLLGITP